MHTIVTDSHSVSGKKINAIFKPSPFYLTLSFLLSGLIFIMLPSLSLANIGSVDSAFGSNGLLSLPGRAASAFAKQADGKLIVGFADYVNYTENTKFSLTRFNQDGSVDYSFGNGEIQTDFDGGYNFLTSISVQPNGKIVAVGRRNYNLENLLVVARYNPDGSLDNSFDGDGRVTVSGFYNTNNICVVQSDEKIVISSRQEIIRINSNGSLDNSFGPGGKITADYNFSIVTIAVQTDNKIVISGYTLGNNENIEVLRFNTDGYPDKSFAGVGKAITDLGSDQDRVYSLAFQNDGKIVVAGTSYYNGMSNLALIRYNSDGSLDNAFNGNGIVFPNIGPKFWANTYVKISIQPDGKIIATGGGQLARFNANGSTDNSLNGSGILSLPSTGIEGGTNIGSVISGNDVFIILAAPYNDRRTTVLAISLGAINPVPGSIPGLNYRYYTGDWNELPDFEVLTPAARGTSPNIDISARPTSAANQFAFIWEGYIKIETPGMYTFETVSDDGSKFYFNSFYSSDVKALVNNDGIHPATAIKGSVNIPNAGYYPVAITYFEKDAGESIQLFYSAPGIARQPIPNSAFVTRYDPVDVTPPGIPGYVHPIYKGRRFVRLDWANSTDNVGIKNYLVYNFGNLVLTTTQSFAEIRNLTPGQACLFSVRAVDFAGNVSELSNQFSFSLRSQLLNYKLFENVPYGVPNLRGLTAIESGAMNNVDLTKRPTRINSNYAYVWEGFITIPTAGNYTFTTLSDDGSRFYFESFYAHDVEPFIDNFDNNGLHAAQSVSRTINIPAPGLYPIALLYHQYGGDQEMKLYWQGPGFSQQPVPDEAFTSDIIPPSLINGLNYKYYEGSWTSLPDFTNLTPIKQGQSPPIDLNVRPAGRNENFAFLWEGYIDVAEPGEYTFETVSDDGSKLYFNSKYVPTAVATVDNDGIHDARSAKGTVYIAAQGRYPISISYFEQTGEQKMEVYWSGPSVPRQRITAEAFSPYPSQIIRRLNYSLSSGTWTVLPDFTMMSAVWLGSSSNIDISKRPANLNDGFGFLWQGYINIPVPGYYTFETISDDGSQLYISSNPYFTSSRVVDNNGIHPAISASGSVYFNIAGVYGIQVSYFELNSAQSMEVYWSGPGISRQRIPDEAFPMLMIPQVTYPFTFSPIPSIYSTDPANSAVVSPVTPVIRSVYPNPFDNAVTVDFYNDAAANNISIGLFDLNGRKVFMNQAGKLPIGDNIIRLNVQGTKIPEGVYILQVQKNGIPWKTARVVRINK